MAVRQSRSYHSTVSPPSRSASHAAHGYLGRECATLTAQADQAATEKQLLQVYAPQSRVKSADLRIALAERSASDANAASERSAAALLRLRHELFGSLQDQLQQEHVGPSSAELLSKLQATGTAVRSAAKAAAAEAVAAGEARRAAEQVAAAVLASVACRCNVAAAADTETRSLRAALEATLAETARLRSELAGRIDAEQAQRVPGAADAANMAAAIRAVHECCNFRHAAAEAASEVRIAEGQDS